MYNNENKSVSKSIRITPTALSFIERFKGNGFNEKLNSLVMDYYTREKDIDKAIKMKQEQLAQKEKQFQEMCAKVREVQNLADTLQSMAQAAKNLDGKINEQIQRLEGES